MKIFLINDGLQVKFEYCMIVEWFYIQEWYIFYVIILYEVKDVIYGKYNK